MLLFVRFIFRWIPSEMYLIHNYSVNIEY
jgi:hypothetical protein